MADIFISYKREDQRVAERLSIALEQLGFDVWWDLNLISGQPYRSAIRAVIDQCKAAIVLWSEKSVQSDFVMDEASYAQRLGKLCPARIDGVELPMGFGQTHTADLVGWDGETSHRGFQNVVDAVEARVGRKGKLGANARTPEAEAGAAELEAFKTAQYAGTAQALRTFLQHFPRGMFASFVRGQLETMGAHATQAAAAGAAAPPHETPRAAPGYQPPSSGASDNRDKGGRRAPWPWIAGALALVAIVAVSVALMPRPQPAPQSTDISRTPAMQGGAYDTAPPAAEVDPPPTTPPAVSTPTFVAYDVSQLNAEVRRAVLEARAAEVRARDAASRARAAASRAEDAARRARAGEAGAGRRSYNDGDRYEGELDSARARDGYGIYYYNDEGAAVGSQYSGQWRDNDKVGVGVHLWGENSSNTTRSLRYEGEWADNQRSGAGVYFWVSGAQYFGQFTGSKREGYGVHHHSEGTRYEGQQQNNLRSGYGVLWDAQGRVMRQGIWADGNLSTPLSR